MQWWYYRGQVTTPIDIPGKGPTVLRPRDKFQAPFASVAHLRRLKKVVPCKAPEAVPAKPEPAAKIVAERAVTPSTVVASESEPQAKVTEPTKVMATVEETTGTPEKAKEAQKEKEKEKAKAKRSKHKES